MHEYSIADHPKNRILFYLAAIAIALSAIFTKLAKFYNVELMLTSAGVFTALYFIFDYYFWRIPIVRGLLSLPNLNGEWSCDGISLDTEHNEKEKWQGTVTIVQRWTKISIYLRTQKSESASKVAHIYSLPGKGYKVTYSYSNTVEYGNKPMTDHSGSCELLFDTECQNANGSYFNGPDRWTCGKITLKKAEK